MKNCTFCGNEFESKRADARFCSARCRVAAARIAGADPNTGEILDATGVVDSGDMTVGKITSVKRLLKNDSINLITLVADPLGRTKDLMHWGVFADPSSKFYIENPFHRPPNPNYDREKALEGFKKMGLAKVEWLTTGIKELDAFQKIPRGRVTQIQGPYAVGKTTLAVNMVAGMKGVKVFYVDSEASLNPDLLTRLEVDLKNFDLYNDSAFIEDVYEVVLKAAQSGKYDMIVVDSLASMTFRTEQDGKSTDRNIGQKALVVNKLMRVVPMILKNTDTALVIINQEREVIGSYVPMKYTPGGMGVPYAASLILALKTIPSWRFPKDAKNGLYLGHEIEVTVAKSKVSQPHRKTKIKLFYPEPVPQEEVSDTPAF